MQLIVNRLNSTDSSTIGTISIDGKFKGFTLEDPYRAIKVAGETRIPSGSYKVILRDAGGMNVKYSSKYGEFHKGMLWLQDVPGFEWVYLHIGNTASNTEGCILVGASCSMIGNQYVGNSAVKYEEIYEEVASAILSGDEVTIELK